MSRRGEQAVHALMQRGVERAWYPSACLLVARDGQPVLHRAYGRARLDTLFDLASLTKPLAATTVAMRLTDQGKLRVGDRVARWLPELERSGTRGMRVWQLLAHASGLPAWLPLFRQVAGMAPGRRRAAIRRRAAAAALSARPGERAIYSDLGYILLDWLLERCGGGGAGSRLDRQFARLVAGPLGLERTLFSRLDRPDRLQRLRQRWDFAPTERCPWRGRRLVAEVHDDNCHAMGGVSAHAGLFSTAHEVHLLAREVARAYHGRDSGPLATKVVRRFLDWGRRPAGSTRVLGWDTPAPGGSSAGRHLGPGAVGHLGFTGTSLWIDLPRRTWVVLLTNRVYHGREPNPLRAFRPRLHDAVMRWLGAA
jgi:CubicO group peptidase (beta-lactamase class C family)